MSLVSLFPHPYLEGTSKQFQLILESTGWKGEVAPYTYELEVAGITTSTNGDLGLSHSASVEARTQARSAQIAISRQETGKLYVVADGEKPTVNIPITITTFPQGAALDDVGLPAWGGGDNNKVLAIVQGTPTWVNIGLNTDDKGILDIAIEGGN